MNDYQYVRKYVEYAEQGYHRDLNCPLCGEPVVAVAIQGIFTLSCLACSHTVNPGLGFMSKIKEKVDKLDRLKVRK